MGQEAQPAGLGFNFDIKKADDNIILKVDSHEFDGLSRVAGLRLVRGQAPRV